MEGCLRSCLGIIPRTAIFACRRMKLLLLNTIIIGGMSQLQRRLLAETFDISCRALSVSRDRTQPLRPMKTLHSRFMSCISPSWITVASAPASKVAIFTAQSKADMPSRLRATHQLMTTQKHRLQHKGLDFILQMPCHPADGNTLFRKVYGCMHTRAVHTPRRLSTCMIAMSCLLYTSPSPRDATLSRMPSSA